MNRNGAGHATPFLTIALITLFSLTLAACAPPLASPTAAPPVGPTEQPTIRLPDQPTPPSSAPPPVAVSEESTPPSAVRGQPSSPLTVTILPDAAQSYKQVSGRVPFTVAFRADITGGVAPLTYAWDFDGDNKTDSTAASPAPHIYTEPRAYNAALTVRDANANETRVTRRIVAFTAPKMPDWKYGITAHLERRRPPYYPTLDDVDRAAKMMKDAGIQAVRVDFNWDLMNPQRDEWKFEDYDQVVKTVRSHNVQFVAILDYVSWWASSAQDSQDWRTRLYSEPLNNYDFAQFTFQVVDHFKSDVHVWQIWNEPNTVGFWKPKPNPARYASLLQGAYLAAKYADPDAVVLFAGMSSNGIEGNDASGLASNFIERSYQAGARGYFDAMAIHPYMLPNGGLETLRERISAARAVMNQYGDADIPLWLTEIGVPTDAPWWQTAPIQSEQDAANWLKTVYTGLWDLTPSIYWYEFLDYDKTIDPEDHFGILHQDYSLKPGYTVLQELTKGQAKK